MKDRMNIANVFAPIKTMKREHQYTLHTQKTMTKLKHRTCKITNQPGIRKTNEKNEDQITANIKKHLIMHPTVLRETDNALRNTR